MDYFGVTLNGPSMLGLTLSVGIVIDDCDRPCWRNIFRYIEEKGYEPFSAAIEATKRDWHGGNGHDSVAGCDFSSRRLHAEHPREIFSNPWL